MEDKRKGSGGGNPMFIHIPKEEMDRILGRKPSDEDKEKEKDED